MLSQLILNPKPHREDVRMLGQLIVECGGSRVEAAGDVYVGYALEAASVLPAWVLVCIQEGGGGVLHGVGVQSGRHFTHDRV